MITRDQMRPKNYADKTEVSRVAHDGYALVTGASSGIGRALAYQLAKEGKSLILVARNNTALREIQAEITDKYSVDVITHQLDLSDVGSAEILHSWAGKQGLVVHTLVNNAGFGDRADVIDADLERLEDMVQVNVVALVGLSKLFGADMVRHKQGKILNIASVAGFLPGPRMAVYYASKAFVISFSQALYSELAPSGVTVTTVCPGPTKSGFAVAAKAEKARLFRGSLATSEEVATFALQAMNQGKLVAIHGMRNRALTQIIRLLPSRLLLLAAVRRLQ